MTAIHPKLCLAAWAATIAVSAAGCTNQAGALKNPFSTVDRVPPPATRMVAPGTAQPYYQGDPLPVMQSATGAPAPIAAVAATVPPTSAPVNNQSSPSPKPKQLVFSNEPTVAIPSDGSPLRFELPAPPEPATNATIAEAPAPAQACVVQAASLVAPSGGSPSSAVVSATYEVPAAATSTGPWRSPQVASPTAPSPAHVPQPFASTVVAAPISSYPPQSVAAASMDVQMRAVPSPAPEAVSPTTPRIRLPGYSTAPPLPSAAAVVQPMTYFVPAGTPAAAGTLQTMPVSTVPQGYFDPTLGAFVYTQPPAAALAPPTTAISASGDGFRPRGSGR